MGRRRSIVYRAEIGRSGWIARLQRWPREGPESGRKPSFDGKRNRLHRPERPYAKRSISACALAISGRGQTLPGQPIPRLAAGGGATRVRHCRRGNGNYGLDCAQRVNEDCADRPARGGCAMSVPPKQKPRRFRSMAQPTGNPVEFVKHGAGNHVRRLVRKASRRPDDKSIAATNREQPHEEQRIEFGLLDEDPDGRAKYVQIELPDDVSRRLRVRNRHSVIYRIS